VQGRIIVEGRIGFSAQSPWTYVGTVRENILFGKPYNKRWYDKILAATTLVYDCRKFPAGDSTLIGDKGITLSGGQKARINLARALYADGEVFLLDDVLSAVDPRVGQEIWRNVVEGILKEKCLLMTTNQVQFISNDAFVIILDGGKIKDFGKRQEVEERNPDSFLQPHQEQEPSQPEPENIRGRSPLSKDLR